MTANKDMLQASYEQLTEQVINAKSILMSLLRFLLVLHVVCMSSMRLLLLVCVCLYVVWV